VSAGYVREKVMYRIESLRLTIRRLFPGFLATLFVTTLFAQLLPLTIAEANQITTRSITMSTSAASAQAEYTLTFTPATTYTTTATSLIVDFCANDPLISDTCTFSAATVPTVSSGITSSVGTAGVMGSGSPIHTISVTAISGGFTAGTPIIINFDATPSAHLTNPTTNVSFYARVLTWNSTAGATSNYTPANTSGLTPTTSAQVDTGGIALSTAANITITATVYETLSFCVFQTACGTTPNLILGNSTTGALSTSSAYVNNNAQYTIATNAGSGAAVFMTGSTLCRPGGTCATGANAYTIKAIGNSAVAAYPGGVGTEQFGMCVDTTGVTGTFTAIAPYKDTINNCHSLTTGVYTGSSIFGFYDSASNGTNSPGGDEVMASTGVIASYTGTFTLAGNIAAATPAGIYSTSLNMVATGTF
jgi:hypothetical protein